MSKIRRVYIWDTEKLGLGEAPHELREREKWYRDSYMAVRKAGILSCSVHFLIGYCPETLEQHEIMADDIVATFPEIDRSQFNLGKVTSSAWCKSFTIAWVRARLNLERIQIKDDFGAKIGDYEIILGSPDYNW